VSSEEKTKEVIVRREATKHLGVTNAEIRFEHHSYRMRSGYY